MNFVSFIVTGAQNSDWAAPLSLRTGSDVQVCISSGDPDPSATAIRRSELNPIAKLRASEILREARSTGRTLAEDVSTSGDGGLIMEFIGLQGRELMITISAAGAWTYFSAAIDRIQTTAGIMRDDGIQAAIHWVCGLATNLEGPGIIAG